MYRRIGHHPAFSQCFHVGAGYLVLRRLQGTTLYDCLRQGIPIPVQVIDDVDAALACGLHGHDVHGRNLMLHRAWEDLRWAYRTFYRPLIGHRGLRVPGIVLDGVRRSYRLVRRIRAQVPGS